MDLDSVIQSEVNQKEKNKCISTHIYMGFPGSTSSKEHICQCRRCKRHIQPLGREDPRRAWQPTPVFLSGESHGQRSLVGYGP